MLRNTIDTGTGTFRPLVQILLQAHPPIPVAARACYSSRHEITAAPPSGTTDEPRLDDKHVLPLVIRETTHKGKGAYASRVIEAGSFIGRKRSAVHLLLC